MITRRSFLRDTLTGLAAAGTIPQLLAAAELSPAVKYRIGSCVVDLDQAKLAGLDGAEIRVGNPADKLQIADPAIRQRYKEQMSSTGLVISSFMMGLLNEAPLASDPRGPAWLEQSIDGAKDLKVGVILVAFFGKGDLLKDGQLNEAAVDVVVKRLQDAAPRARDAGVILALENRLSAKQNLAVLDRIGHASVRIYYDVGNLTNMGYDVAAEIRFLKDRIVCFHFKDGGGYIGKGKVPYDPIAASIKAIGYQGWIVMETPNPSKDAVADAKRNAAFIRKLFTRVAAKPAARRDRNFLSAISNFGHA
jgi:sugar phosphate isomerase/epimerase